MMRRYRIRLRQVRRLHFGPLRAPSLWPRTRRRVAAALAVLVAATGACAPDEEPATPETGPPAGYQQPPEDLCEQVRFEEVLQRWDLVVPSWHEADPNYSTEPTRWYVRCGFTGEAEDGRFETEIETFQPSGAVQMDVYHETAEAVEKYDRDVDNYFERPEGGDPTEVTEWWDTGVTMTLTEELNPDDFVVGDFEITSVTHQLLVRHENLVVFAHVQALSPTEETDEAAGLLEELVGAMLDESAGYVPHSG